MQTGQTISYHKTTDSTKSYIYLKCKKLTCNVLTLLLTIWVCTRTLPRNSKNIRSAYSGQPHEYLLCRIRGGNYLNAERSSAAEEQESHSQVKFFVFILYISIIIMYLYYILIYICIQLLKHR